MNFGHGFYSYGAGDLTNFSMKVLEIELENITLHFFLSKIMNE